ncbi:hypothetical protein V1503_24230 [Bacillus sp. SCS-151]|uniref:hypothetical protein n=1 Tax=Nanhaiella sioensis TaxID=3115293 RepID=UPI003977FE92
MRLIIWVIFSAIISIYTLYNYWPDYEDNEFPLFTDIFLPIFLASYYVTFFAIPSLLLFKYVKQSSVVFILTGTLFLLSFLFSLNILLFSSVIFEVILSLTVSLIAWYYIILSVVFLIRSK